jgi:hypothetical protein
MSLLFLVAEVPLSEAVLDAYRELFPSVHDHHGLDVSVDGYADAASDAATAAGVAASTVASLAVDRLGVALTVRDLVLPPIPDNNSSIRANSNGITSGKNNNGGGVLSRPGSSSRYDKNSYLPSASSPLAGGSSFFSTGTFDSTGTGTRPKSTDRNDRRGVCFLPTIILCYNATGRCRDRVRNEVE